jgi:glycosyltransferase involved in cell wall biosynthesis
MLWDKGVGTLVEAARLLHDRMDVRVVLVGEPDEGNPARIEVQTLNRWVEEGYVEWWGWQGEMRSVYAACIVVTLPSLGEGIPTVLLEAAACGRPLVATDVPGCRDVVQEGVNGLLVPPQDPAALAEALHTLLIDEKLRARMGAAGRPDPPSRRLPSEAPRRMFKPFGLSDSTNARHRPLTCACGTGAGRAKPAGG